MNKFLKLSVALLVLFFGWQLFATAADAQRRDHLTGKEIELVRDVQEVDLRMEIFVKAIDRRLLVLNNDSSKAEQIKKDAEKWGELPAGNRAELLSDIQQILDEAISKVDDVADHDLKNKLLPVAVNILADGANRFAPELKSQLAKADSEREKGAILNALEFCDQIIEASAKVPKLSEKERRKIQGEYQKSQPPN